MYKIMEKWRLDELGWVQMERQMAYVFACRPSWNNDKAHLSSSRPCFHRNPGWRHEVGKEHPNCPDESNKF